jgi:hypothetical protein
MNHRYVLAGGLVLALFGISLLSAQEPKQPAAKGKLPAYWSKLGLSADQRASAVKITGEYGAKIDALKAQIHDLEKQEKAELEKVLTDEQKKKLRDLIATKAGIDIKDDKKEDKKDKN